MGVSGRKIFGGILLLCFFISSLAISTYQERIFVSPDESAAYVFAKTFAETGSLTIFEPLNLMFHGILHPRSMVAIGGELLPGGFLGMPVLTGSLHFLFGPAGALLFTPLLAFFAILAWRKVVWRLFDDQLLADLSAFFLIIHPAFWYYSGRVMMNNVAFVSFLIFAAYFAVGRPFAHIRSRFAPELHHAEMLLAGICAGTALFLRTAELPWVVVGFVALLFVYRTALGWRNIAVGLIGLLLMLGVTGFVNASVFGSPFTFGYTVHEEVAGATEETSGVQPAPVMSVGTYLLPFGFHPRAMLRHAVSYELLLYPWMTVPAVLGFLLLFFTKWEKRSSWRFFALVSFVLAVWLGAVYGSWTFTDNPDPRLVTLGNSYVRYWLPLFVLSTVFAAYAWKKLYVFLWRLTKEDSGAVKRILGWVGVSVVLLGSFGLSARLVWLGEDGIIKTRHALESFLEKRHDIFPLTESDAVIVVDRADKYLFPGRKVVTPLRSEVTYAALPDLVKNSPTYYFGITLPERDMDYLNTEKLFALGLQIELVKTLQDESLYKLYPLHE